MGKKLFFVLIFFLLPINCVNAVYFKVLNHFTKISENYYLDNDFFLSIQNTSYFKSNSLLEYNTNSYKNNTYIANTSGEENVFELNEFEGNKYMIQFWSTHNLNNTNFKNLIGFNKLNNNLTGIKP